MRERDPSGAPRESATEDLCALLCSITYKSIAYSTLDLGLGPRLSGMGSRLLALPLGSGLKRYFVGYSSLFICSTAHSTPHPTNSCANVPAHARHSLNKAVTRRPRPCFSTRRVEAHAQNNAQ
eukprot:2751799-Prymnesium_polylepis.1